MSVIGGNNSFLKKKSKFGIDSNLYPMQAKSQNEKLVQHFEFIPQDVNVLKMEFSESQTFLLSTRGRLYVWGLSSFGQKKQLGQETVPKELPLEDFKGLNFQNEKIIDISAGNNHILVLTSQGRVFAWGINNLGQLGNENHQIKKINEPQVVETMLPYFVHKIYAKGDCSFAIAQEIQKVSVNTDVDESSQVYSVFAWGDNRFGQLGVKGIFHVKPQQLQEFPFNSKELHIYYNTYEKQTYFYTYENISNIHQVKNYVKTQRQQAIQQNQQTPITRTQNTVTTFSSIDELQKQHNQNNNLLPLPEKKDGKLQIKTNSLALQKQIRLQEYKNKELLEEIEDLQNQLKELQEKNEEELLNQKDEYDDPIIKELEKLIEELIFKKQETQQELQKQERNLKNVMRDQQILEKQQREVMQKSEEMQKKKFNLQQQMQKQQNPSQVLVFQNQLKVIKEVLVSDDTQKNDIQRQLYQIQESIGQKQDLIKQISYKLGNHDKKLLAHQQLLNERKIKSKKNKTSNYSNKIDVAKIISKVNSFQKALKETNIQKIQKKQSYNEPIENTINESDRQLRKIEGELNTYRNQNMDGSQEILGKFLQMIEKNIDQRKQLNNCFMGLMLPTSEKLQNYNQKQQLESQQNQKQLQEKQDQDKQQQKINQQSEDDSKNNNEEIILNDRQIKEKKILKEKEAFQSYFKQQQFQPQLMDYYYRYAIL